MKVERKKSDWGGTKIPKAIKKGELLSHSKTDRMKKGEAMIVVGRAHLKTGKKKGTPT